MNLNWFCLIIVALYHSGFTKNNKLILFYIALFHRGGCLTQWPRKSLRRLPSRQQAVINSKLISNSYLSCTSLLTILDAILYVFVFVCLLRLKNNLNLWITIILLSVMKGHNLNWSSITTASFQRTNAYSLALGNVGS